ncbi:cytospin-A-like [Branchiostoma floridae x Branchiostoma belcheri]
MKRSTRPPFGTSAGFRPPSSLAGSRVGSFRGVGGRSDLMSSARSPATPGQVTSSAAVISRSRHYLSRSQEHLADDPTASRRVPARPKSSLGLATAAASRKTSSSSNASSTSAKDSGSREKNGPSRENGGSKDKTVATKEANSKEKSTAAKETAAKTEAPSKDKAPKEKTKSDTSSARRLSKDKATKSRTSDKRVQPVAPTRVSSGRDNEVTSRLVASSRIDMDVLKEELRQVRLLLERQVEQGPATSGEERSSVHETLVKMIEQLQQQNQTISQELTGLRGENRLLRERLSALGLSLDQKTDAEKELLLLQQGTTGAEAASMMSVVEGAPVAPGGPLSASSSSPGSMEDLLQADVEANLSAGRSDTPDNLSQDSGDLLGSGSMRDCTTGSEVSMVDLQERIIAMEENQQSVSEELEATIQELTEQQMTVEEISSENEQLQKENAVIMESLRQQTERLEQSRAEVEELKTLLAQKQPKLEKSTSTSHLSAPASPIIGEAMRRVRRSSSSSSERSGQATTGTDAAVMPADIPESHDTTDSVIGTAQVEAERAKSRCAELERSLGKKSRELARLEDRVRQLEADRTSANDDIRDLKFQLDHMTAEVRMKDDEISGLRESAEELEQAAKSHVSEKRQDSILISELQGAIKNLKQQKADLEQELTVAQRQRESDAEEWRQFQADLQTAVVIANDMRTESQEELVQLKKDYNELKQRLHNLQASPGSSVETTPKQRDPQIQGRVQDYLASVEKDLSALRQGSGVKRPDSASPINVKSLVKSFNVASQSPPSPTATVPPTLASPVTLHGVTLREKNPASTANPQWRHSQPNPSLPRLLEDQTDSPQGKATSPGGEGGRRSSVPTIPELEALKLPEAPPSTGSKEQTAGQQSSAGQESRSPVARGILKKKEAQRTVPVPTSPANGDRRDSITTRDPLAALVKRERGGSKRNALLKWCQRKTQGYTGIDITNFSTSWNDGLSFCALLHSYLPDKVPFSELTAQNKRKNFTTAFQAGESVGIPTLLSADELVQTERPDWQAIMAYVTAIYAKFENV